MADWSQLARQTLLNNSATAWIFGALAFVLTFALFPLLRGLLRAQRRRHVNREPPVAIALLTDLVEHTSRFVLWIWALYVAEKILTLPKNLDRVFDVAIVVGIWMQIGIWTAAAARFGLQRQQARTGDPRLTSTMDILLFVLRLIIWAVVALLALENLGINVGPLVAGLGVGGIAIALAVQTVLSDLFASLSIALDKPFVIGDSLRIDNLEGTVEQIGIKSTRLRSVSGEQIILANADLLKSRVRNLGRASERRGLFMMSVAYDTPTAKLEQIPKLVGDAVASYQGARFVYCLLKELGESGLQFEVCFFVENRPGRDVTYALDQINRQILAGFERVGIGFAHPARTLWVKASSLSTAAPMVAPDA
ncbi:MAG TPA: mechanosensitive ion channel family protein [Steroidobacteraceae bacterium]|nr:mechanosensitive ion channel family protein [Steroidobacteraceae bacterium]